MLEFAQQLVSIAEGLLGRTYFEPTLIAFFGLTLILSARVISRITAFLTLHETEHRTLRLALSLSSRSG